METITANNKYGSAEELANSSQSISEKQQLTDRVPIEDTPFVAVRIDNKWMLTMGRYRMSNMVETLEEVEQMTADVSWNRLISVMTVVAETVLQMAKDKETKIQ